MVGPVERHVEADRGERRAHARPDLLARDAEVLAAEGDVVPDPGEDHLGVRVLQDESCPAATRRGGDAVDEERSRLLALVRSAEHTGEAVQQRRLARPRGAEQQHALSGLDAERCIPDRPRLA